MRGNITRLCLLLSGLLLSAPLYAAAGSDREGAIVTLWPLFDYRESSRDGYSNLSILGPLIKIQHQKQDDDIAVRPLFYRSANSSNQAAQTTWLYPLARTDTGPDVTRFEFLQLLQHNVFRKNEGEKRQTDSMLFPFYISGTSENYGPYTSVFPIYGDIYERFWKDEYHYVLFPLYSRTVKNGTSKSNYLYPFFTLTEGVNEKGFQFWPLYGEAEKKGVYRKKFVLWPFYLTEESGLDTDNPTSKLYVLPFYAASESPKRTSRYYFWPFIGHMSDSAKNEEEWDYFWPLLLKARGAQRNVDSYFPFYSREQYKDRLKTWYMWPLYKHEEEGSGWFRQERDRILFFLYSDRREQWPKDGSERRTTAMWPLFLYKSDQHGVKSISLPAPVEPVVDRPGIERNWAPLWRIYQQKWRDNGDSAASFLWNLYWHEARGNDLAYEFYPLVSYRSEKEQIDLKFLKGLVRYRNDHGERSLSLLWLPFGPHWGSYGTGEPGAAMTRSQP